MAAQTTANKGRFTTAPYMRNLLSVTISNDSRDKDAQTVIRIPLNYHHMLEGNKHVQWKLQARKKTSEEDCVRMNVIPICSKPWGDEKWQWQCCMSAGGILSVLVNECKSSKVPPEENKTYELSMTFS